MFRSRYYTNELDETSNPVDTDKLNFGKEGPMFEKYNNEPAYTVYESMAGGTAQINIMSDFFQESENEMKTNEKIFNGFGFNLGNELPYIELVGPRYGTSNINMDFSTSEIKTEPYMNLCETGEKTTDCLKRVFECDSTKPWKNCDDQLQTCKDDPNGQNVCKYDSTGNLLKKYETNAQLGTPQQSLKKSVSTGKTDYIESRIEPFMSLCKTEETVGNCLKRVFDCDPDSQWKDCNRQIQTCKNDPDGQSICKYNLNNQLIARYMNPQFLRETTQQFCEAGETSKDCLRRYGCTETDAQCDLKTCDDDPNYVCKTSTGQRFLKSFSPVSSPPLSVERRGVGEFFSAPE